MRREEEAGKMPQKFGERDIVKVKSSGINQFIAASFGGKEAVVIGTVRKGGKLKYMVRFIGRRGEWLFSADELALVKRGR